MNKQGMTVTVIGCDGRPPGPDATKALAEARTVIGAPRHLRVAPVPPHAEQIELRHLDEALDAIAAREGPTAVLASGDPGFFGIVRALRARGITPHVIPAVSSVADAFARIGLDWDDALVVSAHGRDPRPSPRRRAGAPQGGHLDRARHRRRTRAGTARRGQAGLRGRAPRHPRGEGQRPARGNRPRRPQHPHQPRRARARARTQPARRAGWPATRAPRTAGRCPRTRSSTATR